MSKIHTVQNALLTKFTIAVVMIGCLATADSFAQQPSSSRTSLAVDEVTLASGKRMYGIVMKQDSTSLTLLVERVWFEKTYPDIYATHVDSELESELASRTQQLFRLEAWWKSRVDDTELVTFIDEEMGRIEKERDAGKASGKGDLKPFTLITYPIEELKAVHIQSPAHHQLAGLGWKHDIDRVTTRPAAAIQRELEKLKVDTNAETFDLSDQLPVSRAQSELEWSARVALIEFKMRTHLEFQGMGSNLIRVDPNQPGGQQADIQALMTQFMGSGLAGGQVDELLKELGIRDQKKTENDWWKKAAEIAEREGMSGFLVTRLVQNASSPSATVEQSFFAQLKPGRWKQVVQLSATANRNDVKQADVDRIKADPQIKKVLGLTKGLGLGSDDLIDQAIRQGAATEMAMEESRNKFYEFLDRYTKRTDRPMLELPN